MLRVRGVLGRHEREGDDAVGLGVGERGHRELRGELRDHVRRSARAVDVEQDRADRVVAHRLLEGGAVEVVITPTYSGCPAMGQIEDDIHLALQQAKLPAKVITRLAPAWTTDWMTNSAREKLKAYGIAPPGARASGSSAIQFATKQIANYANNTTAKALFNEVNVPCPRCGSPDTTETSHFASTACKALYKCLACLEPFDYFKPH